MRVLDTLLLAVFLTAAGAAPALAQQASSSSGQTVSSSTIDATLANHESRADQQRARLAELLAREDVQDVAQRHGIDMGRVQAAAAGFSDAQMNTVAPMVAAAMPQQGDGGLGTVTISVALAIILLLVLILVT